jgi:hypothetical protein
MGLHSALTNRVKECTLPPVKKSQMKLLTVTMQLNQSRLLDLFAQNFVVQRLQIFCRICSRFTPRFAQKSASQPLPSQLHGYGLGNRFALVSPVMGDR